MDTSLGGNSSYTFFDNFESYGAVHPGQGNVYELAGWKAGTGNEIEILSENTYLKNGSTNYVMEVEGIGGGTSVSRDISTSSGEIYTLSVDYSPRSGHLADSAIGVYWEGQLVGTLSSPTLGMQTYTFDVVANSATGSSTLEFRALDSSGAGGLIDNVKLTSTPSSPTTTDPVSGTEPEPAGTEPVFTIQPVVTDPTLTEPTPTEPTPTEPTAFFENFEGYGVLSPSQGDVYEVGGWTAASGNEIEILSENTYLQNGSVNKVMEVEGIAGGTGVSRDFSTRLGDVYTISVDYSPRSGHLTDSAIGIYWEGELVGILDNQTVGMQSYAVDVVANSTTGTSSLEFRAMDSNGTGGVIDNVGVQLSQSEPQYQGNILDIMLQSYLVLMFAGIGMYVLGQRSISFSQFFGMSRLR